MQFSLPPLQLPDIHDLFDFWTKKKTWINLNLASVILDNIGSDIEIIHFPCLLLSKKCLISPGFYMKRRQKYPCWVDGCFVLYTFLSWNHIITAWESFTYSVLSCNLSCYPSMCHVIYLASRVWKTFLYLICGHHLNWGLKTKNRQFYKNGTWEFQGEFWGQQSTKQDTGKTF